MAAPPSEPRIEVGKLVRFREEVIDTGTGEHIEYTNWSVGQVIQTNYVHQETGEECIYLVQVAGQCMGIKTDTEEIIQQIDENGIQETIRENTCALPWEQLLDMVGPPNPIWSDDDLKVIMHKFSSECPLPPNFGQLSATEKSVVISYHAEVSEWLNSKGIAAGLDIPYEEDAEVRKPLDESTQLYKGALLQPLVRFQTSSKSHNEYLEPYYKLKVTYVHPTTGNFRVKLENGKWKKGKKTKWIDVRHQNNLAMLET